MPEDAAATSSAAKLEGRAKRTSSPAPAASVPPGVERTMVWGYTTKTITENRYRLLKALRAEKDSVVTKEELLDTTWLTRLPNQVLKHMVA